MIVTTNTKRRLLSVSLRRIEWLHRQAHVAQRRQDVAFSIPSSDRMAASQSRHGDRDRPAGGFQYPFVGSNGCISTTTRTTAPGRTSFQYPFVGSNGCIPARAGRAPSSPGSFSIPSSDRMAASPGGNPQHPPAAADFQYPFVGSNGCILGTRAVPRASRWPFQYPFVGSNGCISSGPEPESSSTPTLSVSLRRIEWLHRRSSSPSSPRPRRRLSVSLRRIEWLHLRDQADAGVDGNQPFSIPSSDRMAASLECDAHWSASHNASFSIPSSDRMAASCVLLRVRGVWHSPFQYPFVGSNGCIIQRHPAVQGEIAELSVSLRRIEWLHRSADCISTCGCGRLSVSLRRIEWLHRTRRTGSTCCRCRLSVSLRRIEWLHPPAGTLPATPSRTLCRSTAPFSCHSQHRLRPLSCSPPAFRRKSQFCASGHPFCEPSCHFPRLGNTWTARPGSPTAPFRPHSAPGSRPGLRH